MTDSITAQLDGLLLPGLAETAQRILPDLVQLRDPQEAAARVVVLAGLPPEVAAEIGQFASEASKAPPDALAGLLRAVLEDVSSTDAEDATKVSLAASNAGKKQIVVGPEFYFISILLMAAYIVVRRGGETGRTREVELSEDENGRLKIKFKERVEILNPFSPLANLLKRVLGAPGDPPQS